MIKNKSIVVSQLPDAGLGNKLFTWAHGIVFAKKNNLQHYSIGLTRLKIGPILRKETSLRFYRNYFKSATLITKIKLLFLKRLKRTAMKSYSDCNTFDDKTNELFIFNEIPHWSDYFKGIRENRDVVVKTFFESLNSNIYKKYSNKITPIIGVHFRMGDFKKISAVQDFSKVGHARTPIQYFIDVINELRIAADANLPVTIFSDGNSNELSKVLSLSNVHLAEDDLDILHMLHLSKSKVIVLSAGSTFGHWSAFLSNAAIIHHYQHYHSNIRDNRFNEKYFEGVIHPQKELHNELITYLKKIKK